MSLLKKPSLLVIAFSICFSFVFMDLFRYWHSNDNNFKYDVVHYYSYLPAYVYNGGHMKFNDGINMYLIEGKNGERMTKVTYGMAALYSPFFLLAHKIAVNQNSPRDGFSEPYSTCLHWGSIFYALLGLFFLRQFLIKYFDEKVTAFTLLLVLFGTNLFAYTYSFSEMSHAYLFMLVSGLMYLSNTFYEKPTIMRFALLGFFAGFISLIRPTDSVIVFVFLLWNISGVKEFKERVLFFLTNYRTLIAVAIAVAIWIPQLLFWKSHTGSYFYFSYPGEGFFWTDPQIMNILFSFRKGWFLYTPVALVAFLGFFFMKKQHGKMRWSILGVMLLMIYVYSCWWDWIFGGGFSGRTFVPYYAILAIPLASFIKWVLDQTYSKYMMAVRFITASALFYFMCLNVGQTHQVLTGLVHYNAMTKEGYIHTFGKYVLNDAEMGVYWKILDSPNYEDLSSGKDRNQ